MVKFSPFYVNQQRSSVQALEIIRYVDASFDMKKYSWDYQKWLLLRDFGGDDYISQLLCKNKC